MTDQNRTNLWEELKVLQATINKFDDFSFRIKNWFITISIAITGYAISKPDRRLLYVNFGIALIFYFYEITYRIAQGDFLRRLRDVQQTIRTDVNREITSPYMDIYLFDTKDITDKNILVRIQKKFKLEEDRAKRNVRELKLILSRSYKYLFQLRISLLYILGAFGNIALLLILR
jgi:hypothetical protein